MRGICKICGYTLNTPCYTHKEGYCWWIDEKRTICSHCYYGFTEIPLEDVLKFNEDIRKEKKYKI